MNSSMKEMDVKALIEQIETKEEDFILTALQTYNKEVTVTCEPFHKDFSLLPFYLLVNQSPVAILKLSYDLILNSLAYCAGQPPRISYLT